MLRKKRKREETRDPRLLQLADLPDHLLGTVSSLLPPPEAALLAVSFGSFVSSESAAGAGLSSSEALQKIRAIVDGREGTWKVLNYGEIEPELAARLADEDLAASLKVIDAWNEVKTLRLTGCVNITGTGLLPLMGSTTIEVIDLSLTCKGDNPRMKAQHPKISFDLVLPILESIIRRENVIQRSATGCSLMPDRERRYYGTPGWPKLKVGWYYGR